MFDKLRWPDSLSLMWCVISPGWPQGAVLTKLTSILLVQMSWWELESHRQTCLSYPHVRNWGFKGWTARPHSSSVWPCRGEERRVFFFCLQHHRFTNVSLSRAASWGCAAFSLCYIFVIKPVVSLDSGGLFSLFSDILRFFYWSTKKIKIHSVQFNLETMIPLNH